MTYDNNIYSKTFKRCSRVSKKKKNLFPFTPLCDASPDKLACKCIRTHLHANINGHNYVQVYPGHFSCSQIIQNTKSA